MKQSTFQDRSTLWWINWFLRVWRSNCGWYCPCKATKKCFIAKITSALSQRQRTVSELINETQSEEEEPAEHTTAILGNSPVLENSDNSRFVPSLKTGIAVAVEKNRPVNLRDYAYLCQPGKKKNEYECFSRWHAERAKAIRHQQKSTVLLVCTL